MKQTLANITRKRTQRSACGGFTMVEVVMTVLVGSLLVLALTRIFSSGMLQSQRGSSHLTNLQTASILLARLEKDFSLAAEPPALGGAGGAFSCNIIQDFGTKGELGTALVSWQSGPGGLGFQRSEAFADGPRTHIFGEGLLVQVLCEQVQVAPGNRTGFYVEVTVSKPPDNSEKNTLRRFIYGYNLTTNRTKTTHDWKW